jgi:hypothetical protein
LGPLGATKFPRRNFTKELFTWAFFFLHLDVVRLLLAMMVQYADIMEYIFKPGLKIYKRMQNPKTFIYYFRLPSKEPIF